MDERVTAVEAREAVGALDQIMSDYLHWKLVAEGATTLSVREEALVDTIRRALDAAEAEIERLREALDALEYRIQREMVSTGCEDPECEVCALSRSLLERVHLARSGSTNDELEDSDD